jgi:hypothetical protein
VKIGKELGDVSSATLGFFRQIGVEEVARVNQRGEPFLKSYDGEWAIKLRAAGRALSLIPVLEDRRYRQRRTPQRLAAHVEVAVGELVPAVETAMNGAVKVVPVRTVR